MEPALVDDYVDLHENDFSIDQGNDPKSFEEEILCQESGSGLQLWRRI